MGDSIYERIHFLTRYLNECTAAYDEGHPKISDEEWDTKYFELLNLENECQYWLPESPTRSISFTIVNSLEKVEHNHDMLSLEKTKALTEIKDFLGNVPYLAMCKMDGLTCSLKYVNGELVSAETRGNGRIGENILHNARVIPSIPNKINYKDILIVDGEIICSTSDFALEFADTYANPRNFAAGSIRLLDSKECAGRKLQFVAWDVIDGFNDCQYLSDKLTTLKSLGFTVVPYCGYADYERDVEEIKNMADLFHYPIDGVVFKMDDIEKGLSMGKTSHHFRNAMAYKFYDETYTTKLINIEWSMGRTGVLTPIAIFEPIDIDGSTVERASLHNWTVLNDTLHGHGWRGQEVEVFKANMIIPQIASAEEDDGRTKDYFEFPALCPICGHSTILKEETDSVFVICDNDSCEGKLINKLDHFCGKKGMDIRGLSKATLEKLVDWGWIENFSDIYRLHEHENEWVKKPGFGVKSVQNILNAIESSRQIELHQFIAALGIPLIGTTASKTLTKYFDTWDKFIAAATSDYNFTVIDGFGIEMDSHLNHFNYDEAINLVNNYISFNYNNAVVNNSSDSSNSLEGKVIVITGKLQYFKNRDALTTVIESHGGKVAGSVSKNTSYLVNNDNTSTSAKNKSAQSLGIPIITEQELLVLMNETFD